jgi:amidase
VTRQIKLEGGIKLDQETHTFVLEEATINSVHKAMLEGHLSCRQLVEMYLKRIERFDKAGPSINSIIMVNPMALEIADELDNKFKESGFVGPLHGIPVLLKDNFGTNDMPTTAGSIYLEGCIPEEDAFVTRKLREAGAIILAKMNLHEFAIGGETASSLLGQTLNPYDLTRTPGGSSGGTAAGIAMNFGLVGLGTDTVNSVRSPASGCNLVGLRPTHSLVSKEGVVPSSKTQDQVGPITRTVEDSAKVLNVISGLPADAETAKSMKRVYTPYDTCLNKKGLESKRIGVLKSFFGQEDIHQEVNKVIQAALDTIEQQGAILIEIEEELDAVKLQKELSMDLYEFKAALNEYLQKMGSKAKVNSLKDILVEGNYYKGIEGSLKTAEMLEMYTPEYDERYAKRMDLKDQVTEILTKYDVDALVFPHQKRLVVKVGESQLERNGILGSLTGFPACVIPAGFTTPSDTAPLGVPVGIEFLTSEWNDPVLIEMAYGFEQATQHRKAPVF